MRSRTGMAVGALATAGLLFVVQPSRAADMGASADVGAGVSTKSATSDSASTTKTAKNTHHHHHHAKKSSSASSESSTGAKAGMKGSVGSPAGGADVGAGADTGAN